MDPIQQAVEQARISAGAATANAADAVVKLEDAAQQLPPPPAEVNIDPALTKLPYHERELKTMAQLLSLKIASMVREFNVETGAKVDYLKLDYNGKVDVHVRSEGSGYIYA